MDNTNFHHTSICLANRAGVMEIFWVLRTLYTAMKSSSVMAGKVCLLTAFPPTAHLELSAKRIHFHFPGADL